MDEWGPFVAWDVPATGTPLADLRTVGLLARGFGIPLDVWARLHNEAVAEALGISVDRLRGVEWLTPEQHERARVLLEARCRDDHEAQGWGE